MRMVSYNLILMVNSNPKIATFVGQLHSSYGMSTLIGIGRFLY